MYEFLKFILTGGRLQKFKRFSLTSTVSAIAETACAVPLLFVASPTVHAAASVTFGVLVILFGALNTAIAFYRSGFYVTLVNGQIFAEEQSSGEVSEARKVLAEKCLKQYAGKRDTALNLLGLVPLSIYLAASVISVLVNLQVTEFSYIVPVLFVIATICTVILTFIASAKDAGSRAAVYEAADREIALLKREAGIAEALIAKQAYNAKNTATRSQELFLRDPADRLELRRLASVLGYGGLALAIILIAGVGLFGLIIDLFDGTFLTVSSSCLIAAVLILWIAVAVWVEIRRRAVYRRNAEKLTDSEPDKMRRFLQGEFIKLQRNGNIFFSVICGIPTAIGFVLGALSAVNDPELSLIENAAGMAAAFFFISGVAAILIWLFVYAVYRKKVKPVEMQLDVIGENYGKTN